MKNTNRCRVLLIDPDAYWIKFALDTLKRRGISAQGTTDLDKIGRAFRLIHGPQLTLVNLEFAENSPDQLRRLAQSGDRHVVVLFPTSLTPYEMSRVFKLGVYDCVDKPYDAQSLVRLVESLVKEICSHNQNTVASLTNSCLPVP